MVNLGDEVKDKVSGFRGIAVSKHLYLQGCARISVQPKIDKEGKLPECQAFDEPQLEIIKSKMIEQGNKKPGGPMPYKDKGKCLDKRVF